MPRSDNKFEFYNLKSSRPESFSHEECAAPSSGQHTQSHTNHTITHQVLFAFLFLLYIVQNRRSLKATTFCSIKTVHPGRRGAESPFQNLPARTIIKQTASENLLSLDVSKGRINDCMYQLVFKYLYLSFVKREVGEGLMHAGQKRFTEGDSSINCSCGDGTNKTRLHETYWWGSTDWSPVSLPSWFG